MAETCAHAGCNCPARADGYCSDSCAAHKGHTGSEPHACGCGHPDCHAEPAGA